MTANEAKTLLVSLAQDRIDELPIARKIDAYTALSMVLPNEDERRQAGHVAWLLTEAAKHQMDLFSSICDGIGMRNNGDDAQSGGDQAQEGQRR